MMSLTLSSSGSKEPARIIELPQETMAASSLAPLQIPDFEPSISSCCKVCLRETGNTRRAYNAKVCDSCRVFFRRAITSSRRQVMTCHNPIPGQCEVKALASPLSKICRKCRFDRCLSIGMKPSLVIVPNKTDSEAPAVGQRPVKKVFVPPDQIPPLAMPCTVKHLTLMEQQHWFQHTCKKKSLQETCRLYCTNPHLLHELLQVHYHDKSCSAELIQWKLYCLGQCALRFINMDSAFYQGSLNSHDHAVLVRARSPMMQEAIQLMNLSAQRDNLHDQFTWLSKADPGNTNIQTVLPLIHHYRSNSPMHSTNYSYGQIFSSPWAESQNLEDRHRKLVSKQLQIIMNLQDLQDDILLEVFNFLIFYSPNEPGVKDSNNILKMRQAGLKFAQCLLSASCGSEDKGLIKMRYFLDLIPLLHESSEISKRRLPV